jgi:hypothetical protein
MNWDQVDRAHVDLIDRYKSGQYEQVWDELAAPEIPTQQVDLLDKLQQLDRVIVVPARGFEPRTLGLTVPGRPKLLGGRVRERCPTCPMHRGNGPGSAVIAAALRGPRTDHSPTTESSPVLDGAEPLTFLMSTAAQLGRRARTPRIRRT